MSSRLLINSRAIMKCGLKDLIENLSNGLYLLEYNLMQSQVYKEEAKIFLGSLSSTTRVIQKSSRIRKKT